MQTPEYIQALLVSLRDRRELADDVDCAVRVRVNKQHIVYEGDHRFAIVIEEAALRFRIGTREVMAGQLGHLLSAAALPSISLGIVPLSADRSAVWPVEGFFVYDDEQVNVELVSGHLTLTQPGEIEMYSRTFNMLADLAVFGSAARTLIRAALAALDASDA